MVPQTRSDTSGDRARQAGHGLVCLPRASASLAVSSAGQVSIRSRGQSAAKLATACRCARPCRPATGGRAGSGAGPKVLGFPPAGFRKEPEQHHEQCCWNEGDQPGCREPVAGAGHCAEGDQAGDGAQHTRGQRSNCPNPAAKAAIAAPTTARSLQRCNRNAPCAATVTCSGSVLNAARLARDAPLDMQVTQKTVPAPSCLRSSTATPHHSNAAGISRSGPVKAPNRGCWPSQFRTPRRCISAASGRVHPGPVQIAQICAPPSSWLQAATGAQIRRIFRAPAGRPVRQPTDLWNGTRVFEGHASLPRTVERGWICA